MEEVALGSLAYPDNCRWEAQHCWWREQEGQTLGDESWAVCELRNPPMQSRSAVL